MCISLHEFPENYDEWKELISKGYIVYDFIYNILKMTTL